MKTPDWIHYIVGNIRCKMYYDAKWMLRKHILDQIEWRINSMKPECFTNGACVECGCKTLPLQMCNKACDGNCYPPIFDKKGWLCLLGYVKSSTYGGVYVDDTHWEMDMKNKKFKIRKDAR